MVNQASLSVSPYQSSLIFVYFETGTGTHPTQSMKIVPSSDLSSSTSAPSVSLSSTAGSKGLHDTLRYGPRTLGNEIKEQGLGKRLAEVSWLLSVALIPSDGRGGRSNGLGRWIRG